MEPDCGGSIRVGSSGVGFVGRRRFVAALLAAAVATPACVPGLAGSTEPATRLPAPEPSLSPAAPASPTAKSVSAPPAATKSSGTLRFAGASPQTLDPALTQDSTAWGYMLQLFGGLVAIDERLEVVPDLAESWTASADGRVYTFRLRADARFHDGRAIAASDVKFSLERALDPATKAPAAATYLGDIVGAADRLGGRATSVVGIVTPDERTVEIRIDAPKPYFLAKLSYPTSFIVDRANVDRANVASGASWSERPNGTGPFRLAKWSPDDRITLTANSAYHRGAPKLAQVEYRLATGSAISWYEKDEIDVVDVGPANVERVTDPRGQLGAELRRVPQLSVSYLGYLVGRPPFDDSKVRRAFALATDKRRLADVSFKRMREPAAGILPPGLPGHDPAFAGIEFDPAKARALLAESRYAGGAFPPVRLTTSRGGGSFGESLAEMYARNLGVAIDVEEVQDGYFDGLNARSYQMFYLGWVADYPDPQDFLDVLLHSASETNHGGYSDPSLDALLERARTEADRERRLSLYRQAESFAVGDAAIIPLFFDTDYLLVKPRVRGLNWTPLGAFSLRDVTVAER